MRPVSRRRLFFDIQVLIFLLGEYTLFDVQISAMPLLGYGHFSTIFFAHLCVYTCTIGSKRSLTCKKRIKISKFTVGVITHKVLPIKTFKMM